MTRLQRVAALTGTTVVAITTLLPLAANAQADSERMRYCGLSPSGTYQVRAGEATSCPFARATATRLREIQVARGGIPFGATLSLRVYSRVTHRSYRMRCSVSTPPVARIACWGGNGAQVWIGPRS